MRQEKTSRTLRVILRNVAILLTSATMTASLCAQVTVTTKGNLKIGEIIQYATASGETTANNMAIPPGIIAPIEDNKASMDSLATLCLLGTGPYSSGAYATFGNKKQVWIGEMGI